MSALSQSVVTILDGGMGRELSRMGAPFGLPEWSALALIEAPEYVRRAHDAFIAAGAEVITTNSYALVPARIGAQRYAAEAACLIERAGRLARAAAAAATGERVRVAGSLPPVFESYRPDRFDADEAPAILDNLVRGLAPYVDFWLIETQSSIRESSVAIAAVRESKLPYWVSFTLQDEAGREGPPRLRSGEAVDDAVAATVQQGADAVLFNCSQPEVMNAAVLTTRSTLARGDWRDVRIGVYANAFVAEPISEDPYAGISTLREDLDPDRYVRWAGQWVQSGATIVGGCCGIGPEHIAALRAGLP